MKHKVKIMKKANNNESGMVSILVTMILIIVITLIVIGFAQVSRRNQREALDDQLSTQAYYAAESGANVAEKYFQDNANDPSKEIVNTLKDNDCTSFVTDTDYMGKSLSSMNLGDGISYSCLMVNSEPPTLVAAPLTQDSNIVWHLKAIQGGSNTPTTFNSLKFTWANNSSSQFTGGSDTCNSAYRSGGHQLPRFSNWNCSFGILRVDLVDVSTANQATLGSYTNTKTIFMVPNRSGSGVINLPSGQVAVAVAKYNSSDKTYSLTVNGVTGGNYYARLTMLYQSSGAVTLSAGDLSSGIRFEDGQAVIDSTGKAQDELRRVQYRIPLKRQTDVIPNFGLQSTDSVCKQALVGSSVYEDNC